MLRLEQDQPERQQSAHVTKGSVKQDLCHNFGIQSLKRPLTAELLSLCAANVSYLHNALIIFGACDLVPNSAHCALRLGSQTVNRWELGSPDIKLLSPFGIAFF